MESQLIKKCIYLHPFVTDFLTRLYDGKVVLNKACTIYKDIYYLKRTTKSYSESYQRMSNIFLFNNGVKISAFVRICLKDILCN